MDFFGIGPWELLLILVLALILLGPGKITEVARTLGRVVRTIKKASSDITSAVSKELETNQNKAPSTHRKDIKTEGNPSIDIDTKIHSRNDKPANSGETSSKYE